VAAEPKVERRLGRPPNGAHRVTTVDRLIDAAFEACVELGVDGVSLTDVAARAGVTANAVYRHFDSKSALLVETAKRALDRLPSDDPTLPPQDRARSVMRSFLAPEAQPVRRFVAELVVAAPRHPDLMPLMAQWNDERLARWPTVATTRAGRARVKALYVLLLGACQLEALAGIDAPARTMSSRLEDAAAGLFS
jgi:AcrR family transcriptional regulator